jgi:hypothetical protein
MKRDGLGEPDEPTSDGSTATRSHASIDGVAIRVFEFQDRQAKRARPNTPNAKNKLNAPLLGGRRVEQKRLFAAGGNLCSIGYRAPACVI